MTTVDLWVNVLSAEAAAGFRSAAGNEGVESFFGNELRPTAGTDGLLADMDECGIDVGVVASGLAARSTPGLLEGTERHGGRLVVALVCDRPDDPVGQCARLRDLAAHDNTVLVRVTPLVHQYPLNHRLYYPVYATCAELGLPVSINVGVPGPRVRSACQDPTLLEDVLIDFPGLTVVGAHMGHPYEPLLVTYMLKWPSLYLSNSAYLARYMDPELVRFMGSSRGRGRVLFASDHPFLPLARAVDAARALPLDEDSMAAFLGGAATVLLGLPPTG